MILTTDEELSLNGETAVAVIGTIIRRENVLLPRQCSCNSRWRGVRQFVGIHLPRECL